MVHGFARIKRIGIVTETLQFQTHTLILHKVLKTMIIRRLRLCKDLGRSKDA